MPKVGPGKPTPKNPGVGPGKPAPKNPGVGPGVPVSGPGAAPPPSEVYNPGVPTPVVQPFLTAEDLMAYAQARQAYESQLSELDANYSTSVTNTGYEKEQLTKSAISGKAEHSDDFAARGLFRSSVRDADLFDIDATAEMRKTFLDTQLNTLKLNTETQKHSLDEMWNNPETGYLHALDLKKVQNAQGVQGSLPMWSVEPHMEKISPVNTNVAKKPGAQFKHNAPISQNPNNGGTTYKPTAKPPSAPKQKSGLGKQQKAMGKLYG